MSASLAAFERPRPGASNTVCFFFWREFIRFNFLFLMNEFYFEVIGMEFENGVMIIQGLVDYFYTELGAFDLIHELVS